MTWWGPFGCGFVAGLFVGQVTLGSWLSSVRAGPLRLWSPATFKSEVPAQSWRKEDRSYSWADGRAARPDVRGARLQ
jgi:hypothetical protein